MRSGGLHASKLLLTLQKDLRSPKRAYIRQLVVQARKTFHAGWRCILCQELSGVTLQHIAKLFKLKRYGTVSTTVGKLKKEISEDSSLSTAVERLSKGLSKGK